MHYKTILLLQVLTLILSGPLSARTAKILYLQAPKGAPENVFIYSDDQQPKEVDLPKNNFTKPFNLPEGDLKLYFLPSKLDVDQEMPKNAPSAKIPANWNKILILASYNPKNALMPVRFKIINANTNKLGNGDLLFINSSGDAIAGKVGNKKLSLQPKSMAIIKNPAKPSEEYETLLNRFDKKRNLSITFIRQVWRQSANQSSVVFIYSPPNSNRITYYSAPVRDL